MTIADNYTPNKSQGNGVTTAFSGNWSPLAADYMRVSLEEIATGILTPLALGSGFTVAFDDNGYAVDLTLSGAPTSAYNVIRFREIALDQTDPYKTSKGFQGIVEENSFDKLTGITQDLSDQLDRTPKFAIASGVPSITIDNPVLGRGLMIDPVDITKIIMTDLNPNTSQADAAASAAAAAASAAAASAAAAAALTSQNAAATSATNASGSATAAATSASSAGTSAANAAGSATAASGSATSAGSSAAAASGSASAAAGSATSASTSATNAGNSATAAGTSATNANNSAIAAAASATAAANSAAQFQGTSATSIAIGTGAKVFATQTGKLFNGENVRVYSNANVNNFMDGIATYSGTSLSVAVTTIGGSGTFTDWIIKVNGAKGATGNTGPSGSLPVAQGAGTVDAITADYTPDLTLADLTTCVVRSTGPNTVTTPTFAPDGLTAHTIVKHGGLALAAGDTGSSGYPMILEYNLVNTRWELLNPAKVNLGADTYGQSFIRNFSGTITKNVQNTVTPGVNFELINQDTYSGFDDGGASQIYHIDNVTILDAAAGSEDGRREFRNVVAGTDISVMTLGAGVQIGAPTGGDKGVGSVNAQSFFVNGAAISSGGPSFYAYRSAVAQSTGNAFVKAQLQATVFDTAAAFDATNNRWVCPVAGYYIIHCKAKALNSIPIQAQSAIYKNGAQYALELWTPGTVNNSGTVSVTAIVPLSVNDYVEFFFSGSTGQNMHVGNTPDDGFMMGSFLNPL